MNMNINDLTYIGDDPGAVKYGNFINYYAFHSVEQRIKCMDRDMFAEIPDTDIVCLDVGCNSGELTQDLFEYLELMYPIKKIKILAVDIDPTLISRAKTNHNNVQIDFEALDISNLEGQQSITKYLQSANKQKFDVTFCFSVTMWIHINRGDEGFENFLEFLRDISDTIIIEPQPWHCYRNAQRRVKKSGGDFPMYHNLKIRSEVEIFIENILTRHQHQRVYESPTSSWKRKIQSYQRLK